MRIKGLLFALATLLALQIVIVLGISQQVELPAIDKVVINEIVHEQGLQAALEAIERTPKSLEHGQRIMTISLIISVVLESLLIGGYLIYLKKTILKPFCSLKGFAARVASGDLDIPLPMDKHNAFGAFTESFDLMRDTLKTARKQEANANRSKKELIAKLSHDIKTPISSILAVTELMQATNTDDKILGQLSVIQSKADQIDRLVSDLFNATLEELQQLSVTVTEQSSQALYSILAAADFQNKASINNIPPCLLIFDSQRLQQVFDNIFSNAYKYGNKHIEVKSALLQNHFEIVICDYGSAVDENELPLLFEKFFRGRNSEGKSGAGLGLYISRCLLREMGGDIACQNTKNGFCVSISLKLAGNFAN